MDISEDRFNEWPEDRMKKELKNLIIEAIQNEYPQKFIDTLIKRGKFTEDEVQEIYKELNYKKRPIN
ncbi:hypothetical protein CW357_10495 [Rummeliibacillus sp. TYF005]|mgnify:CR=1 FL=1|uniref:hypothetical protein n=1 Tax=Rummeliibacillus sp. TYF005 TaxID=2058214 RepID=UPI000F543720|nr:hypothetical protein [Rummeliibacillus sp. TYF005]RPJ95417.1 hypothetical protein CW357_10495 [Rummeliibacillus sp. TYF005]